MSIKFNLNQLIDLKQKNILKKTFKLNKKTIKKKCTYKK